MENRNGLAVNACVTKATGTAARQSAVDMLVDLPAKKRVAVGGDKAHDAKDFVKQTRSMNVTPHAAQKTKTGQAPFINAPRCMQDIRSVKENGNESKRSLSE
jgi:hypothetical protein